MVVHHQVPQGGEDEIGISKPKACLPSQDLAVAHLTPESAQTKEALGSAVSTTGITVYAAMPTTISTTRKYYFGLIFS